MTRAVPVLAPRTLGSLAGSPDGPPIPDRKEVHQPPKLTVDPGGSTWDSEPGQPIPSTGQLTDDGVHVCRTNVLGHHS